MYLHNHRHCTCRLQRCTHAGLASVHHQGADGKTDWDAVIDAEMERRRLLENSPIPATNDEPVTFDTAEIPWYAHQPLCTSINTRCWLVPLPLFSHAV